MEVFGWITTAIIASAAAFVCGYWFGYSCGRQDGESGAGEP